MIFINTLVQKHNIEGEKVADNKKENEKNTTEQECAEDVNKKTDDVKNVGQDDKSSKDVKEEKNEKSDKKDNEEELKGKYEDALSKFKAKETECGGYIDLLKRTKADFDNYKKRTQKEKESIYDEGFADAIKKIIPVLDNLERAAQYGDSKGDSLKKGIDMIVKLFNDTLDKMDVHEIKALGEKFNPDLHNGVMHVDDEKAGENEIVEVLQKGYKYKDKIIRYSMVKVAN